MVEGVQMRKMSQSIEPKGPFDLQPPLVSRTLSLSFLVPFTLNERNSPSAPSLQYRYAYKSLS